MPPAGHSYVEQLARVRAAVDTGRLPPDLGQWVLKQLVERSGAVDRIELRDRLIRAAAALLSGSTRARALRLRAEHAAVMRSRTALDQVRALLAQAHAVHPCPISARQWVRIVETCPDGA